MRIAARSFSGLVSATASMSAYAPSSHSTPLLREVKRMIPPLSPSMHKGQAGRVGVIGGSRDYTGAPYYSSFSSMRLGADLAHVICERDAGNVIKTYSPDLIVHTILSASNDDIDAQDELASVLSRLHALVVGPGLGRDDRMQNWAEFAIERAKDSNMYIAIDADGLWLIQNKPDLIRGYAKSILTPNPVEFQRLLKACGIDPSSSQSNSDLASSLSQKLGGVTIFQKGATDIIVNNTGVLKGEVEGALKRCGGQGDVLSGVVGTMLAWAKAYAEGGLNYSDQEDRIPDSRLPLLAAYGGSCVTRTCARWAFEEHGRAMQTSDMLKYVGKAYEELFGEGKGDRKASL